MFIAYLRGNISTFKKTFPGIILNFNVSPTHYSPFTLYFTPSSHFTQEIIAQDSSTEELLSLI